MRIRLFIAVLLIPFAALPAQATGSVVVGLSSSNTPQSASGVTSTFDSRTGFAVGLEFASPLSNHRLEFTPAFMYVQKGSNDVTSSGTLHIRLNYFEIPVLFRLYLSDASARPFIVAGPHVAIKASCSLKYDATSGASESQKCADVSVDDDVKSVDFGVTLGAGVRLNKVAVSVRYDMGLTNIPNNPGEGLTVRNRAWFFLASFAVK